MIILLALLAAADKDETPPRPAHEVLVRVAIVRGSEISQRTWKPGSQAGQREIIKKESDGRTILIRLTEFE